MGVGEDGEGCPRVAAGKFAPNPDGLVAAAARQEGPVRVPGDAPDSFLVAGEIGNFSNRHGFNGWISSRPW